LVGIGQKLFSKMSPKVGYREIFAEFVEGAKQSPAQWYSIKPLHNGIPSLADLLEVSAENLQTLLSKAGLGNWAQRDKLILQKGKEFCNRILALERYLGMSVTTKSHLMEDHSLEQQEELQGFGDLGEDFGERNHQDQAKADRRLGCVRNFVAQEKLKSLEEVQAKDTKVQAKIQNIKVKRSRGHYEGTEARQVAKRRRRLDAREEVLASPAPVGRMTTLRERRVLKLNEAYS
jgi:hypothetical protein